jgi:transcriptional regulator of acetoin/glycerol metabolism
MPENSQVGGHARMVAVKSRRIVPRLESSATAAIGEVRHVADVDRDMARSVAKAREHFLESGAVPGVRLHEGIVESWRRSWHFGVGCDDLDPPYFPDIDTDSLLVHAARPVLDRLEETLSGTATSLLLTDAVGRVLDRRVTDQSLNRHLDRIQLAPGFSYAEEHVGTNGIGTAIEMRQVVYVAGGEHFTERLRGTACAGAPIRDAMTGRTAGLLDVTCWYRDSGPLMPALVGHAAADIERRLLELGSARERAMLAEFMTADRRGGRPILTLNEDVTIVNQQAADLLAPADHAIVRDRVSELLRSGREIVEDLTLSRGETATIRCRPVTSHAGTAGAVVEIDICEAGHAAPPPGVRPLELNLAGTSTIFARVCAEMQAHCRARTWVLVEGEAGVGKAALAEAVHRRVTPQGSLTVIDGEDVGACLRRIASAALPSTVILRHPERFRPPGQAQVVAWVTSCAAGADDIWLVVTTAPGAHLADDLLNRLPVTLTVPPLRHRVEDVRALVPFLLSRCAPSESLSCGPAAMLLRSNWPGNVAELVRAVQHVLTRRRMGQVRPEDLPESCHATGRSVLSHWETLERDAIIRTLLETHGDKGAAADLLGISRATIYRRIGKYGISIDPQ